MRNGRLIGIVVLWINLLRSRSCTSSPTGTKPKRYSLNVGMSPTSRCHESVAYGNTLLATSSDSGSRHETVTFSEVKSAPIFRRTRWQRVPICHQPDANSSGRCVDDTWKLPLKLPNLNSEPGGHLLRPSKDDTRTFADVAGRTVNNTRILGTLDTVNGA